MKASPQRFLVGAVAAAVLVTSSVAIFAAAAPGDGGQAAAKRITASGVGAVKLGRTYKALRSRRLVGRIRKGCELGGPNTRSARLRRSLKGTVDFSLRSPRRITNIAITGGARARGVGIGATIDEIKAAYKKAKVNHATEEVFGLTLVRIPRSDGGRLHFAVDAKTNKVVMIGIPFIPFCE